MDIAFPLPSRAVAEVSEHLIIKGHTSNRKVTRSRTENQSSIDNIFSSCIVREEDGVFALALARSLILINTSPHWITYSSTQCSFKASLCKCVLF